MRGSGPCRLAHPGFTALRLTCASLQVAYRDTTGAELKVVDIPREG